MEKIEYFLIHSSGEHVFLKKKFLPCAQTMIAYLTLTTSSLLGFHKLLALFSTAILYFKLKFVQPSFMI